MCTRDSLLSLCCTASCDAALRQLEAQSGLRSARAEAAELAAELDGANARAAALARQNAALERHVAYISKLLAMGGRQLPPSADRLLTQNGGHGSGSGRAALPAMPEDEGGSSEEEGDGGGGDQGR